MTTSPPTSPSCSGVCATVVDLDAYRELRQRFGLSWSDMRQIDIELARDWGLLSRPLAIAHHRADSRAAGAKPGIHRI